MQILAVYVSSIEQEFSDSALTDEKLLEETIARSNAQ